MATVNLGRVGFVHKGAYSAITTYKIQDVVTQSGGVYVCIQAGAGHALTDSMFWAVWLPSAAVGVHGAPTKNVFADADELSFTDSASGFSLVKSSWANIKSYFMRITSATGSALLPAGTTAQRDASPVFGATRANTTLTQTEWWNGTAWVPMGGGATGSPGNYAFVENDQSVTGDYTLTTGKNAMSAGPVSINTGVTITVPNGSTWSIV